MVSKTVYITELKEGQSLEEVFVLVEARQAQSRNGPFWDLRLQDCTGQVEAKIWHPQSTEYEELLPEQLVAVQAQVRSFRDRPQLVIQKLKKLDQLEERIDWSQFIPCSSRCPEEILEEIESLIKQEITYAPWRKLCLEVLKEPGIRQKILVAPAAKTIHHAYRGGLLEHTLNVTKSCLSICDIYPALDREILLVAAVFHDLGKAWELGSGLFRDYTDDGRLLGHITLGLQILDPFLQRAKDVDPKLILHLKHMILSHHGEYEYGSPKRPKTPEAMALHYIDNLDAKINTAQQVLDNLQEEGENWSNYQYSLQRKLYRVPKTWSFQDVNQAKEKQKIRQCLLPLKE